MGHVPCDLPVPLSTAVSLLLQATHVPKLAEVQSPEPSQQTGVVVFELAAIQSVPSCVHYNENVAYLLNYV